MPMIEISIGELYDRITILRLKRERIRNAARRIIAERELDRLQALANTLPQPIDLSRLVSKLHEINAELWDIEEAKRRHEAESRFDEKFIDLARRVYLRNDRRAALKREIDLLTDSTPGEVKSHG